MALFVCVLLVLSLLSPAVYGVACGPADFDISTLTSVPFWYVNIDAEHCKNNVMNFLDNVLVPVKNISKPSNCRLIFSICKPLPILCPNQGVCKIKGLNSSFKYITWPVELGSAAAASFYGAKNFFRIEFPDGPERVCHAGKDPEPVKTQITFNCEKSAKWEPKLKKISPFKGGAAANASYLQSVKFNMDKCIYQIAFKSSEGCPDYGTGGSPGSPLSTGSILLILFFPSVFLYCVVGAMINGSRKKTGAQLIPNYNFWSDLPYLVLDGFGFVISIITCSKMVTTSNQTYQSM